MIGTDVIDLGGALLACEVALGCLLLRPAVPRGRTSPVRAAGGPAGAVAEPDLVTVVDLVAVAVDVGASVPQALGAVGRVLDGSTGDALRRAGGALVLGAGWDAAWVHAPGLGAALGGLATSWTGGTAAGPALRSASAELRAGRERAAREAAGRLAVRVVVPLGLCFLPAFVLVGLVPVLVSLAGSLLG